MEVFPDDIKLQACILAMEQNQVELLKNTRLDFCNKIRNSVKLCHRELTFKFPDNLWAENRVKLSNELMERFGELTLYIDDGNELNPKFTTTLKNDIPKNIGSVKIEFCNKY